MRSFLGKRSGATPGVRGVRVYLVYTRMLDESEPLIAVVGSVVDAKSFETRRCGEPGVKRITWQEVVVTDAEGDLRDGDAIHVVSIGGYDNAGILHDPHDPVGRGVFVDERLAMEFARAQPDPHTYVRTAALGDEFARTAWEVCLAADPR